MLHTREFWAKYAKAYDAVMGAYSRHTALAEAHVHALEGVHTILESGCGPGHVTKRLLDAGHRVAAVDMNAEALHILRSKCGDTPDVSTVCADANMLPYKDESFDGVSSMLVLWAMENPQHYLREHRRVLKPHGRLVLSGPGPETRDTAEYQLRMFRNDLERRGAFPRIEQSWDEFLQYTAHNINQSATHWFTQEEIEDTIRASGFHVHSVKGNPLYFGQGHIVVARKT